jgi:phospholipid N-methyltransferase
MGDRVQFLRSFIAHPRQVGAVLPTSRRAVSDLLDMASLPHAKVAVELGAGTGVYTKEILARLPSDGRLLAFETDRSLAGALTSRLPDRRLEVLAESAEGMDARLAGARPEVIVSALPFTSLPGPVRQKVLDECRRLLAPGGVMLVLQYSPFVRADLESRWPEVRRRISPLNVPPAFLYACRAGVEKPGRR